MNKKEKKSFVAWMGFSDGEPDMYDDPRYYGGVIRGDLFKVKSEARRVYSDVRKVKVEEL